MRAHQLEELSRQYVSRRSDPMCHCVENNQIEFAIRMAVEPAATIIDHDLYFRVLEEAGDLWVFADQIQIARIELNHRQLLHRWMMSDHLSPRTEAQANHQDLAWLGMKCGNRVGAKNLVDVGALGVDVHRPIVRSTAVNHL